MIVHDPDAPKGDFTHWVLFDIPADTHTILEGSGGTGPGVSGLNDFGKIGYGGPCPPPAHGPHRYLFTLYALDTERLDLPPDARRGDVEAAIQGHILAQAQLMGRYERKQT